MTRPGPAVRRQHQRQVIRARARFDCALNDYRRLPVEETRQKLITATHALHALEPWAGSIDDALTTIFEGGVPCSAA